MTASPEDLRDERDRALLRQFCQGARQLRHEFREWVQEELKDVLYRAECLEPLCAGPMLAELRLTIVRLRDINREILQEAVRSLDSKITEVEAGAYDNLPDARAYLEEGVSRLEGLVRELLRTRRMLEGYEGQAGVPDPDGPHSARE